MYILSTEAGVTLGVFTSIEKLNKARELYNSHPVNEKKSTFTEVLNENTFYDDVTDKATSLESEG